MTVIGIIAASDTEILGIKALLNGISVKKVFKSKFIQGTFDNKKIVIAVSGIGSVNAAVYTQLLITQYRTDIIVNIGIAGAINENLNIGDTVLCKKVSYGDFDNNLLTKFSLNLNKAYFEPSTDVFDNISFENCIKGQITEGTVASFNTFISDTEEKKKVRDADCVDMESAAVAHTCHIFDKPFIIIKLISDNADCKANKEFKKFLKQVPDITTSIINCLLKSLGK